MDSLVSSPNPPNVISLSWGEIEARNLLQYSSIFAAASAKGITVYASTGDYGANNTKSGLGPFTVNYPASDPHVVAVGGTEVYNDTVQGAKQYYEYGWSGSGGGYSALFQEPSYQINAGIPDQSGQRAIPDVSLDASSASCVYIFYNMNSNATGVYGTSVATPMMAGISAIALTEGYSLNNNALYSVYNSNKYGVAFHDIYLSGNNGYAVKTGWDEVTGLGSINLQNFAAIYSQPSGLSLNGQSLIPTSVDLSQSFTLSYTIGNPNSTSFGANRVRRKHSPPRDKHDDKRRVKRHLPPQPSRRLKHTNQAIRHKRILPLGQLRRKLASLDGSTGTWQSSCLQRLANESNPDKYSFNRFRYPCNLDNGCWAV